MNDEDILRAAVPLMSDSVFAELDELRRVRDAARTYVQLDPADDRAYSAFRNLCDALGIGSGARR